MFSNGKFKNIVAETEINEVIAPSQSFHATYSLLPLRGVTKNWIAVEGSLFSSSHHDASLDALNSKLASSTPQSAMFFASKSIQQKNSLYERTKLTTRHHTIAHVEEEETTSGSGCIGNYTEKNVFAINVSYYVKIKLSFSSIGGDLSLKLPFYLGNLEQDKIENETAQKHVSNERLNNAPEKTEYFYEGCHRTDLVNERNENKTNERSLDSSISELNSSEFKHENVVQAQVHERKYLESDM